MCEQHERLEHVVRSLSASEAQLVEQVEALQRENLYLAMRNGKLKAQVERDLGEDAESAVVIDIIEYWAATTGHGKAKVSAAGERAKYVRKALKLGHTPDELKEAIDGAAAYPFVVNKQRSKTGKDPEGKDRYDDLPTVFRDEVQIQRMRKLAQRKTTLPPAASAPDPLDVTPGLKQPIDRVLVAIYEQSWECPEPDVWVTSCPVCFNLDKLVIRRHQDGIVAVTCERGCEMWRLLKALDLEPSDLWHGAQGEDGKPMADHLSEAAEQLMAELAKYKR